MLLRIVSVLTLLSVTLALPLRAQNPVLDCPDQTILIPEGEYIGEAAQPTVSSSCGPVSLYCDSGGLYPWPRFTVGNSGSYCTAIDACGESTCLVAVTVEVETDPGCEIVDFRHEFGSVTPGFFTTSLGDGTSAFTQTVDFDGLEIMAVGSSLGPQSDNGTFVYQTLSGSFRVEIPRPYEGFSYSDDGKGGLMVRWGQDADAARAMAVIDANNMIEFAVRRTAGGLGESLASPVSVSGVTHLALEWNGSTVRAEYSTDDRNTWIQPTGALFGQATVSAGSGPALAGMVVSSQTPPASFDQSTFYFDYFKTCDLQSSPPSSGVGCNDDDFEDDTVGSDWTFDALGNGTAISAVESNGVIDLTAAGPTAFLGTDNLGLLYRTFTGDFRTEVTVDGSTMTTGGAFRKAGLMVLAGLGNQEPRILANLLPFWNNSPADTHLQFAARQVQGGPGNLTIASDVVGVPRTVRLAIERQGDVFTVQYSVDGGTTWITPTGGAGGSITVVMPAEVVVALDVVSNNVSVPSTARFDDFTLCKLCTVEDHFDDDLVDPDWTLTGVGNANQESVVETGGMLELTADGATAFFGADNAGFLYRQVTGDFRAQVKVDGNSMTTGGLYRKAGLMVREDLDPWSVRLLANLVPFWAGGNTAYLQFAARETYGSPGYLQVSQDVVGVPRVVDLAVIRQGDTLSIEYSIDGGVTWIQPNTGLGGSITIPGLASTLYVGLDMVSNDISVTSTARFDDFSVCAP